MFETNTGEPETYGQLELMQVAVIMDDGSIGPFDFEVRFTNIVVTHPSSYARC